MATTADLELAATRVNLCLRAERQLLARNDRRRVLPVTIVTGFLGAGKTSLLQHILQHKLNLRVACAVSDLAAVNIDALLVANNQAAGCNQLFQLSADTGTTTVNAFQDVVWHLLNKDTHRPTTNNGNNHAKTGKMDNHGNNGNNHAKTGKMDNHGNNGNIDANHGNNGPIDAKNGNLDASNGNNGLIDADVDCLVMETSGTTDPTQLIAAVRQNFGRMTRARLDSVVVVVDGDAVAQDAAEGLAPCAVARHQLESADVVLLNKVDLLSRARLRAARAVVARYAPRAAVHETAYARVFLPHVLDISAPDAAATGSVSHEAVPAQWHVKTRGARRTADTAARADGRLEEAAEAEAQTQFESVVLERATPIALAAVHKWLEPQHRPKGLLRAKGVLHIAELPHYRFVVQLSGKQRLDVVNAGEWQSPPKTQFVVIGCSSSSSSSASERFDKERALEQLETCLTRPVDVEMDSAAAQIRAQWLAELQADARFDTLLVPERPTVVAFRLTCPPSTVDSAMLRHHHHVDMNEVTLQLVRDVNASGGGALLLYGAKLRPDEDSEGDAVYAVASIANLPTMWDEIARRAELHLIEVKRKLATCRCGF
ncbi:unnamed protein product [Hyaloperonospora brassicae]|uniref:CobW C-terminal domain-containing protein n=1 Tax=Hyaloperonospora brassicae TaxID=162125 RepID=A0AAV0TLZ7_HYABA|nr:unnamed protein product [Hyaloperonospora brassicae]